MCFAHDTAKGLAGSATEQHARSENRLSHGSTLIGERIGNHGLSGGSVCSFADADQSAGDKQKHKRRGEAASNGGEAPEGYAGSDDLGAACAVGEEAAGNTGNCEDHEKPGLQGTQLCVR